MSTSISDIIARKNYQKALSPTYRRYCRKYRHFAYVSTIFKGDTCPEHRNA